MIKYIKYTLLADWSQPYQELDKYWIVSDLWQIKIWDNYYWYISWDIPEWINQDFNIIELTQEEMVNIFKSTLWEIEITIWQDWKLNYNLWISPG